MCVPVYALVMDAADHRWLSTHRGSTRCFPCSLRIEDRAWAGWIGYRGRYSRWFRKPSLDLWFAGEHPSRGRSGIHLNAAYRDPSLLRGRLSMSLFADLGVPVPHCQHVWLTLNGRDLGLYSAFEALGASWLKCNQMDGGAIYYAVGTQGNFGQINPKTGHRKQFLAAGYEKCCPADDDFAAIEELIRSITWPDDEAFAAQIDTVINVDLFLRWLVGVVYVNHTDGLVQNYALIHPPSGRWQISPWDCDGTWGRVPNGGRVASDHMPPGHGAENYLIARLLRTEAYQRRYLDLWETLLSGPLSIEHIEARLDTLYRQIRPAALRDHRKRWGNATFRREPAAIRAFAAARIAYLRERLLTDRPASQRGLIPAHK